MMTVDGAVLMMMMDGAALLPHDGGDVCYLLPALMVPAGAHDDEGWCCSSAARRR